MIIKNIIFLISFLFVLSNLCLSQPNEILITQNGKPSSVIILPNNADEKVLIAADDLVKYINLMSGADVEIKSSNDRVSSDLTKIIISPSSSSQSDWKKEESYRIRTTKTISGDVINISGGNTGVMYGVYDLIERMGVRFFHSEDEYIPNKKTISISSVDIYEQPMYEWRGIQQHTLHIIPHTSFLMAHQTEENLERALRYVEWIAKTRQNYLFWWWVEKYNPNESRDYVRQIVDHAHKRGVKIGMVVGMPFNQQNSYNIIRCTACHSDREAWLECLHKGVDEIAELGVDTICIFFGDNEGVGFVESDECKRDITGVQAVVERAEALNDYLKLKYPHIDLTMWVHPTAHTPSDDERVGRFFELPKLVSDDIGAAVHTVMFYNILEPAQTYGNQNFKWLREFAFDQIDKRPIQYWPETAYACAFDVDVPVWWPCYISSRWIDAQLFADKIQGHITFSTGLEYMYWLHDYAVAKFAWNPNTNTINTLLDDFVSIFPDETKYIAKDAIYSLIDATHYYLIKKSEMPEYNLMHYFDLMFVERRLSNMNLPQDEMDLMVNTMLPDLKALTAQYKSSLDKLESANGKLTKEQQKWFDELYDAIAISHKRCEHQYEVHMLGVDLVNALNTKNDVESFATEKIDKVLFDAKEIIERRSQHYRYNEFIIGTPQRNTLAFSYWERLKDHLKRYLPANLIYDNAKRGISADVLSLDVYAPLGNIETAIIDIPEDFPTDIELALLYYVYDTDSPEEGVLIIGDKEYQIPMSHDSRSIIATHKFPPNTFKPGRLEVKFMFNDTVGGTTKGYVVSAIYLAELKD